jgi:hypothetical protein
MMMPLMMLAEATPGFAIVVSLQFREVASASSDIRCGRAPTGARKVIPAHRHATCHNLPICGTHQLLLAQLACKICLVVAGICIEAARRVIPAAASSNVPQ